MSDSFSVSFNYLWDQVIYPSIVYCKAQIQRYYNIDYINSAELNISERNLEEYKEQLAEVYLRKREWLKREYLPKEDNPVLDFHKIGALLCRSVIAVKPFSLSQEAANNQFSIVSQNEDLPDKDKLQWEIDCLYINYKVAFLVAAGIAYIDLLYLISERIDSVDGSSSEEKAFYQLLFDSLKSKKMLLLYPKSSNHDDFNSTMIVALMKHDIRKRDFDYLAYGAILFQWQYSTKCQLILELLNDGKIAMPTHRIWIREFLGNIDDWHFSAIV